MVTRFGNDFQDQVPGIPVAARGFHIRVCKRNNFDRQVFVWISGLGGHNSVPLPDRAQTPYVAEAGEADRCLFGSVV